MNIQQFHYVLAVAELRHFELAAEKCFVAQSTLSTMLSKLEDELGIKIFDRKQKPVGITEEGELLIQQIKRITHSISELEELTKEIKGELGGTIKIGCIPTIAPYLLPLFLIDFAQKHPEIFIEIKENTTNEIIQMLRSKEIDIGIVSTPVEESDLINYPLYQEDFVLYDTSDEKKEKLDISALDLDNFWLLEEGHCLRDQVLEVCETKNRKINPSVNVNFRAGSIDSLLRFTKSNKGKTIIPNLATRTLSEEDKKHLVYFSETAPSREVGLITHANFVKKRILKLIKQAIMELNL